MFRIQAASLDVKNGETINAPANLYISPDGSLTSQENGEPIGELSATSGTILADGPIYLSPSLTLTNEPNGSPIAQVGEGTAPAEPGFDVILLIGQSNMIGRFGPIDPVIDAPDPRVFQFGFNSQTVTQAVNPLDHNGETPDTVGPGLSFGKEYADNFLQPGREVLLVPAARGGSGFSDARWTPAGPERINAVARANAAMTQGTGTNRFVAILWHQGEKDEAFTQEQYEENIFEFITSIRNEITGATQQTPFILGPINTASNGFGFGVDAAIRSLTSKVAFTGFIETEDLVIGGDSLHFIASSCRTMGIRYAAQLTNAQQNSLVMNAPRESASLDHWLLGQDNPSFLSLENNVALVDETAGGQTNELGFLTHPTAFPNSLRSPYNESLNAFTICAVVRTPTDSRSCLMGNLTSTSVILEGGMSAFQITGTGVRVNARGGQLVNLYAFTNRFKFIAYSVNISGGTRLDFEGGVGGSTPGNQTVIASNPVRNFSLGNGFLGPTFGDTFESAEFIIFDSALTESELNAVYDRSVIRMASRGVRLD